MRIKKHRMETAGRDLRSGGIRRVGIILSFRDGPGSGDSLAHYPSRRFAQQAGAPVAGSPPRKPADRPLIECAAAAIVKTGTVKVQGIARQGRNHDRSFGASFLQAPKPENDSAAETIDFPARRCYVLRRQGISDREY